MSCKCEICHGQHLTKDHARAIQFQPPTAEMLLVELLEMFDCNGRFITGNKPGDFSKWLQKARAAIK